MDVAITGAFGLAAGVILVITWVAWTIGRRGLGDALGASGALFLTWVVSASATHLGMIPDSWIVYPSMDALVGGWVAWIAYQRPAAWKIALLVLFILENVLHVAFWAQPTRPDSLLFLYIVALDVLFALQLAVTGFPGAWSLIGRAQLSGHRPAPHMLGSASLGGRGQSGGGQEA